MVQSFCVHYPSVLANIATRFHTHLQATDGAVWATCYAQGHISRGQPKLGSNLQSSGLMERTIRLSHQQPLMQTNTYKWQATAPSLVGLLFAVLFGTLLRRSVNEFCF